MQQLNFEVDGRKKAPAEVARAFLKSKGFLK
jgi:glycine betaine/choline ABC-type transport system substrate-binding protein